MASIEKEEKGITNDTNQENIYQLLVDQIDQVKNEDMINSQHNENYEDESTQQSNEKV